MRKQLSKLSEELSALTKRITAASAVRKGWSEEARAAAAEARKLKNAAGKEAAAHLAKSDGPYVERVAGHQVHMDRETLAKLANGELPIAQPPKEAPVRESSFSGYVPVNQLEQKGIERNSLIWNENSRLGALRGGAYAYKKAAFEGKDLGALQKASLLYKAKVFDMAADMKMAYVSQHIAHLNKASKPADEVPPNPWDVLDQALADGDDLAPEVVDALEELLAPELMTAEAALLGKPTPSMTFTYGKPPIPGEGDGEGQNDSEGSGDANDLG